MSFGRQRNMVRRSSRPDEMYYRHQRTKRVDRLVMLEGRPRPKPLLARVVRGLVRLLSRR